MDPEIIITADKWVLCLSYKYRYITKIISKIISNTYSAGQCILDYLQKHAESLYNYYK